MYQRMMFMFINRITCSLLLLLSSASIVIAGVPAGYAGIPWGTDYHQIIRTFPNGSLGKIGEQIVYKQLKPNQEIRQRTFAFVDNRLVAVTVSFDGNYVKKTGLEKLLAAHRRAYGKDTIDRSNAPHLVSSIWESEVTRITFAYAPKRPDMTIVMFQKK